MKKKKELQKMIYRDVDLLRDYIADFADFEYYYDLVVGNLTDLYRFRKKRINHILTEIRILNCCRLDKEDFIFHHGIVLRYLRELFGDHCEIMEDEDDGE